MISKRKQIDSGSDYTLEPTSVSTQLFNNLGARLDYAVRAPLWFKIGHEGSRSVKQGIMMRLRGIQ